MPIYKRPESPVWWVRFSIGGVKVRRSSGTTDRLAAEEFESRLRADLWRQAKLGDRPRYTWEEAIAKWHEESRRKGKDRDLERLAWFKPYLTGTALADISLQVIEKLRRVKTAETSDSTADRHMALVRMILRKAMRDWEWIEKMPKVRMAHTNAPKDPPFFLTRQQFAKIHKLLPTHLQDLAEFSVETGLRMRNVTHLSWDRVDLPRKVVQIFATDAKGRRTIPVPLSASAVAVLRRQERSTKTDRVFLFRGRGMDDANGATFKKAAKDAGLEGLRWHDFRHTWASWHVQSGTPLHVLQELGGWKSYSMVLVYAHLNPAHLRAHVEHKKGTVNKSLIRSHVSA